MMLEDFVLTVRKMIDFHRLHLEEQDFIYDEWQVVINPNLERELSRESMNFVERPVDIKIKTVCGLDLKTDETVDTNCIYITQKDEGG